MDRTFLSFLFVHDLTTPRGPDVLSRFNTGRRPLWKLSGSQRRPFMSSTKMPFD